MVVGRIPTRKTIHLLKPSHDKYKAVTTHTHFEKPAKPLSETARETAKAASATAKDLTAAVEGLGDEIPATTNGIAKRATETARGMCQTAARKTESTLATSKEYIRRNPVPVVIGAIAFGAAVGCMLVMARRKPSFVERYADEPLVAVREAIRGALEPVSERVHRGYDSALDGAGKAVHRVRDVGLGRSGGSLSHKIARIGNNLKFW